MSIAQRFTITGLAGLTLVLLEGAAVAQPKPYIGYAYPAGAQRGTTVKVRLGGQQLNDVDRVVVTGTGVEAKVLEYHRHLNPQEIQLLRGQLDAIGVRPPLTPKAKQAAAARAKAKPKPLRPKGKGGANANANTNTNATEAMAMPGMGMGADAAAASPAFAALSPDMKRLVERVNRRIETYVQQPASNAISNIVEVEVTVAKDAPPGPREIRLVTWKGVSNPLVFDIGELPEIRREPMNTAQIQVLGKEEQSLRNRPADEVEQAVTLPCTLNGQIASGEVNRYRFAAKKGQKLVFSTAARRLIPFLADAVPGWFQPVLTLYDASGHEVAYDDDYRFKPDPVILFKVPKDGEYVLVINDAIFRGREDFLYRITAGELPFVTSLFPLGGPAGNPAKVSMTGWNLDGATLDPPPKGAGPGIVSLTARTSAFASNPMPFAIDNLPEILEGEAQGGATSSSPAGSEAPRKLTMPVIVNGRIERPGDRDVFEFQGHVGDQVVAEVVARRLDSPLDSVLTLFDPSGKILARNDDREDLGAGINTHNADSFILQELPADGTYRLLLEDAAKGGGEAYGYRLRVSPPRPDFSLRLVPSSLAMRSKGEASITVHAIRTDGFIGHIDLRLATTTAGFTAAPAMLAAGQAKAPMPVKTTLTATPAPVNLVVEGVAQIDGREVVHRAVGAEDRMQAFLWRHLVPTEDFPVLVFDPKAEPEPRRKVPTIVLNLADDDDDEASPAKPAAKPAAEKAMTKAKAADGTGTAAAPAPARPAKKFTAKQVAGRLRELKVLYEEELLTEDFYRKQVAECQVSGPK
ncbi:PPC domain-containing protein [Aquisphaera insulae]|uniref:PPC domain-containing protein n=1 Tax=Aquisphaera insulae TaxID=2712864 RepID=UPI0013ECF608|nr:PPC domain-containing protein [Aquisphaera insulae]